VNEFSWVALRRDEVVPATCGADGIGDMEYAVSEWIPPVVIEEEPAVKVVFAKRLLNAIYGHLS
jgi:hypothetical protein